MSFKRISIVAAALTLAVVLFSTAGAPSHARAQTGPDVSAFLAAAALQPGDVPSGMTIQSQGAVDPSQIAALLGGNATAAVSGISGAYEQTMLADDFTAALFGKPVGAVDIVAAFTSEQAAAASQAYVTQNGVAAVQNLLSSTNLGVTISNATTLPAPAIGDEAQEFELTGSISMGGESINLTIDVVVARRGEVQFEAAAAGLQSQSSVAEAMAQANDANIQANLALLPSS